MKFKDKKLNRGFSLLETLVALSILSFVIIGPISLITSAIKTLGVSRNQITAFYMAQEGIEYIKNWRDNNTINLGSSSWLNELGGCTSPNGCRIDATLKYSQTDANNAITDCPASCPYIKRNDSVTFNIYNYTSGNDTIFIRTVFIDNVSNNETNVRSEVKWEERYGPKTFTLEERMFNWR